MSFLENDSIFDLTGLSIADFTLSGDCDEENKNLDFKGNVTPLQPAETKSTTREPAESEQLVFAKLAIRHDIMSHISGIVSDLVAIDIKYSELTTSTKPKIESRPKASSRNLDSRSENSPLDALRNFTMAELRTQLGSLKNFISELDAKYYEAAITTREKIASLEQVISGLMAEVERLRKFY